MRMKTVLLVLVCVCPLAGAGTDVPTGGGPLKDCKWVPRWEQDPVAIRRGFDRIRASADHSVGVEAAFPRRPSLEGLKNYFQNAKYTGADLPPYVLHFDINSLMGGSHKQQCPGFGTSL